MALTLQGCDLWIMRRWKIASQCRSCVARKLNVFTTDGFSPTMYQSELSSTPQLRALTTLPVLFGAIQNKFYRISFANPAIFFCQGLRKLIDIEGHIYNSKVASRLETCNPADGSRTLSISYQISFQMCFSVLIWIGLGQKLSLHLSILIACRTNGLHMIYQQDFIS